MDIKEKEQKRKELFATAEFLNQEDNWRKVRVFLKEIEDFAYDLNPDELEYFLHRCVELMYHRKSQVRRIAGSTVGVLICYLKDELPIVWEKILREILFPDQKMDEQRALWLSYGLMQLLNTASARLEGNRKRTFLRIYASYFRSVRWSRISCVTLLGGIMGIDPKEWTALERHEIFGFMRQFMSGSWDDVIILSMLILKIWKDRGWVPQDDELRYLQTFELPENTTSAKRYLLTVLTGGKEEDIPLELREKSHELIQQDMNMDDNWAKVLVHIGILKDRIRQAGADAELKEKAHSQYVSHLRNLLKLNSHPMVFVSVGESLLEIMPELTNDVRGEIMQEILKELEMSVDTANFISYFLGRSFWMLDEKTKAAYTEKLNDLTDSQDRTVVMTVLETMAVICAQAKDIEALEAQHIPGLLVKGVYSHRNEVAAEARFLIDYYKIHEITDAYGARELSEDDLLFTQDSSEEPENDEKAADENSEVCTEKRKIAFFTTLFNPFTSRDRAIVEEILGMGFEVCLAISDFAWDRNVLPYRFRRKLLEISVAEFKNVSLLTEDVPVYIGSKEDLSQLERFFPGAEIWIVRENTKLENTCVDFPHIVYSDYSSRGQMDREAVQQVINNEVIFMNLPMRYQGVTAAEIQNRINGGRAITGLVDLHAERMICEWNLLQNSTYLKNEAITKKVDSEITDEKVTVYGHENKELLMGSISWRQAGKTAVINKIWGDVTADTDFRDLAVLEFLVECQRKQLKHVVCFDANKYRELLAPYGFLPMEEYEDGMTVDLSEVIVLFMDMKSALRAPYCYNSKVNAVIRTNQMRLRKAIADLYPGKLVLSFPTEILNEKLIRMLQKKDDGETLYVPFAKILRGSSIPQIRSRALNTEKCYYSDLSGFEIREYPDYASLKAQIACLKSINQPITLIDDLYHKGYRFEKIREMIREAGIPVKNLAVSIVSGRGWELSVNNNVKVETVYSIPNMTVWFMESDQYPFVGGDGIESKEQSGVHKGAINSINPIMPYQIPHFLKGSGMQEVYGMSEVCMDNSIALFEALEEEYRKENGKILTFERLPEVMVEPRYPIGVKYKDCGQKKISVLLQEEKNNLCRLKV